MWADAHDYEKAIFYGGNYREKVKRWLEMACFPDDRAHGTQTGYRYGCRCARCMSAHAEHIEKQRNAVYKK